MAYKAYPLTEKLHTEAYDAILPSRPQLSQAGRTVLITGGSSGIGYSIAKSFAVAQAKTIIITGRDQEKLDASVKALEEESKSNVSKTTFQGRVCQIADPQSIDLVWDGLRNDGIHVDVLVLNAVKIGTGGMREQGWEEIWKQYEVNVRSLHHFSDRFDKQTSPEKTQKNIINISSAAMHAWEISANLPSYGLTKNSAALLMQLLASERDPSDTQIISFHPGALFTPTVVDSGLTKDSLNWDNVNLPGSFAVWCASPEATFLHGRFLWSAWDVDELSQGQLRKKIDEDVRFLRVGVHGLTLASW